MSWMTLLVGAGIGCLFITSNVSVQTYFARRRSLAFSIAVTGTAVGVFSFPQLTRLLIDNFAWQGAVLVYGMSIVVDTLQIRFDFDRHCDAQNGLNTVSVKICCCDDNGVASV